ncbi:MAG: hypothetical protein WCL16_06355 [bacterium]
MDIDTDDSPQPDATSVSQCWRMQTPEGAVYGPVSLLTLCTWAMDARVTPGCRVSREGRAWRAAETVALLGLEWSLVLESGSQYGPLHFLAVHELAREIPAGVQAWLVHRPSNERWPYAGALGPATAREFRERLAAHMREVGRLANTGDLAALKAATEERDRLQAEEQARKRTHDEELRCLADEVARVTKQLSVAGAAWSACQKQSEQTGAAALARAQADGQEQLTAARNELQEMCARLAAGAAEQESLTARLAIQNEQISAAEKQRAEALVQLQALRTELDLDRQQGQDEIQKLRDAATAREAATQAMEESLRATAVQAQHEVSVTRAQLIQREKHLADVLREHEKREAAWQRKCKAQPSAPPSASSERVIEVEYESHEVAADGQTEAAPELDGEPPRMAPRDVLAGLEARLQSELAAWEQMHQTKKRR